MMRYAALSLPRWPVDRLRPRPADSLDQPFVLTLSGAGGERLHALSANAEDAGLTPGMGVADARALAPKLAARAADPDGDRAALVRFARWCGRFSPWTADDPGQPGLDGVLLDITGCAHLFGGEAALLDQLVTEARGLGLEAHAAAAPTIGLAWGLARFAAPRRAEGWVRTDAARPALDALPVEALRIGETAGKLRRFGLKTARDLLALPRASLARRFGLELVRRLDQASGAERESLTPLKPQADLRARVRFPEPLQTLDAIEAACGRAVEKLCEALKAEGLGLTRLRLTLYRVDGRARDLVVGAGAPTRDAAHLARLTKERLARATIDVGFGVDLVEAGAALARRLQEAQTDLSGGSGALDGEAVRLADRVDARLGAGAVRRAAPGDSHQPEAAGRWRSRAPLLKAWPVRPERRPLLILDRPEPAEAVAEIPDGPPRRFTWRRVRHDVTRAEGPERIAPDWWRAPVGTGPGFSRDYFRVETREGRRFWLYREGLYGRETNAPAWFVHGAG
ncbi:MAG: DNA polymerase Y family protein [Alphaproteobacteria bacterium]|nr:DNA polymerase Y family protein [Alphaproteobacteria bacterium]